MEMEVRVTRDEEGELGELSSRNGKHLLLLGLTKFFSGMPLWTQTKQFQSDREGHMCE